MDFINLWIKQIIVAVIIGTIIELILPNGNNKKFIKVVIGIFILFNIISPIINEVSNGKFSIDSLINIEKYINIEQKDNISKQLETINDNNIKNVYISNLKQEIKNRIQGKNYIVKYINITLENNDEYKIKSLEINIDKQDKDKNKDKDENENNNTQEEIKNNIKVKVEQVNQIEISIQNNNNNNNNNNNSESNINKENSKSNITNKEKKELKEYLNSTYEINIENIIIN